MSSLRSFRFRELSCCETLEELPEMSLDDVDCIDANAAYFADYMSCFLEHSYSSILQRSFVEYLENFLGTRPPHLWRTTGTSPPKPNSNSLFQHLYLLHKTES